MTKVQTERLQDYSGPLTNTDVWEYFALRPDDIIVNTPPKCGTTWMLNIAMMLIYGRVVPEAGNREDSPWLDAGFRDQKAMAASQDSLTRRRCLKSHTPMDGIAYGVEPTYIVVYRHPADAHFSFRSHVENMKDNSDLIGMYPPDLSVGFRRFLDDPLTDAGTDDLTISSIVHHYAQAKTRQPNGNVHFFHYADLSRDLHGQITRLAGILDISLPAQTISDVTEANTFASMRKVAETSETRFDEKSPFRDQAGFFASGTSNKWEGRLTSEDIERYDALCASLLPPEDAAWLNWGDKLEP
ncbi:sulfotransferase domain-containing protein [Sulfitobacter mediterraneus]|uniref:Aryl sulfotransferase n=1 Tax=Sulfitobacter mediterraneus TaxID=83219 RepID=A0A2T6BXJ6_9RHOB|nr:sulfotransferase domain-containing protein [Sulfitobacter mediterraneus]PTX60687.1 aryl sulfotransferase [Sulfitobacter mediterraneus]